MHRNGNGRIRKVKRKGDGEWTSEREKGRKGETILCARFLCRGSSIARRASAVHTWLSRSYLSRSCLLLFRISPTFFKRNFPICVDRKIFVYSFLEFASEILLFVQLTMVMLSNRSFKLYETVIVGYSTLVMRLNKHWNLWNIDTRELEKTEHKLIFINA